MDKEKIEVTAADQLPFAQRITKDAIAGFLVFLIALPLCLAIAKASGYPPIGGVFTAIVGGILVSFISNSELTIKGPAAGLIVIVAGCVADFGGTFGKDAAADFSAYRMALAVGAVAAVLQILFGLFRAGKLGDFFPTAVVHGLLASIGVIIMVKSGLTMLGVTAKLPQENTHLIWEYPHFVTLYNLPIAIIGVTSLAIMIVYPMLKLKALKAIPSQVVVLLVAIPLAMGLGLKQPSAEEVAAAQSTSAAAAQSASAAAATAAPAPAPAADGKTASEHAPPPAEPIDPQHAITLSGKQWSLNPAKFLINVPSDFTKAFVFPDFTAFNRPAIAIKWVVMFAIIASLESLLSAKAVDLLDPQKRKTDQNRDLFGCGMANLVASCIGGLPMISEIVRSRANVDNGAQSRFANLFHGLFLLLFVSLLPFVVNMIPTAALAAMLVFTGFRLAHPREFAHMYKIGIEQFIVFVTTIVAIVCTDLLVGALIGLVVEMVVNVLNGLPIMSVFSSRPQITESGD
ncbi:MAG TPA: SulP family inorganic anion transporter, partial [Pirellulaceae bacterium]|nr:SulP family inorganic anion transporter [Pirellulaceae bacterium]